MRILPNETIRKAMLALSVVACLGLPVNTLWHFTLLVAALLAIVALPWVQPGSRKAIAMACALAAALLLTHVPPRPAIEEGHNVFLPEGQRASVAPDQLPAFVYAQMLHEFDQAYPVAKRCDPQDGGCWRGLWNGEQAPKAAYAQSLDDIFRPAKYSRVVDSVDFAGIDALRAGFANEAYYHWWGETGVKRASMPYFVMYELNARLAGSELCWQGELLWEQEKGEFTQAFHDSLACRTIAPSDDGRRIYGLGIDPGRTLAMQLRLGTPLRLFELAREGAALAAVVILLALGLRWSAWRSLLFPALFIGAAAAAAGIAFPGLVHGYPVFSGGDDGLTHEGFGRAVLRNLLAGDFAGALRGQEDVYYFMPGMRYLRALGLAVFGETHFGYLGVMLALPLLAYAVARLLLPRAWSFAALVLALPMLTQLFNLASHGYGDPMGYALFLASVWLILGAERSFGARWLGHLLLALAVFVRPNLAIAAGLLILFRYWQAGRGEPLRSALLASSGFAAIALVPLHNLIFGHRFVPLTAAAGIPENLKAPPAAYVHALADLFSGSLHSESITTVTSHFYQSIWSWVAACTALTLFTWARHLRVGNPLADGLLLVSMGMFLPFLFYDSNLRYRALAWICAVVVSLAYLRLLKEALVKRRLPAPTAA